MQAICCGRHSSFVMWPSDVRKHHYHDRTEREYTMWYRHTTLNDIESSYRRKLSSLLEYMLIDAYGHTSDPPQQGYAPDLAALNHVVHVSSILFYGESPSSGRRVVQSSATFPAGLTVSRFNLCLLNSNPYQILRSFVSSTSVRQHLQISILN
jgi:hypothetical protein